MTTRYTYELAGLLVELDDPSLEDLLRAFEAPEEEPPHEDEEEQS